MVDLLPLKEPRGFPVQRPFSQGKIYPARLFIDGFSSSTWPASGRFVSTNTTLEGYAWKISTLTSWNVILALLTPILKTTGG
jgi:hypothetical protein